MSGRDDSALLFGVDDSELLFGKKSPAAPAIAAAQQGEPVTAEEDAAAARPAFGNPQIAREAAARRLNALPNRSVMNVPPAASFEPQPIAPAAEVPSVVSMDNPAFVKRVRSQLDSMPQAERSAALAKLSAMPDAYGKAANIIAEQDANAVQQLPTMRKVTDTSLEAQTQRFIDQGMRPEYAEQQAKIQALSGRMAPNLRQMTRDVVGEQAGSEAKMQAEDLKDAGFWERVGATTASGMRKSGMGLMLAAADTGMLGDKRDATSNILGALRIEEARGKAIPEGGSIFEKSAQGAMSSLAGQAPTMLLSALTGTAAPVLAYAAIQQFGDSYAEGRSKGLSGQDATTRAIPTAAAEVFFERFGMTKALAGLKNHVAQNGVESIPAYIAKAIGAELPAELATTATQYGIDALPRTGLNKKPSLLGLYKDLEETLRQTVLQAGASSAVVLGAGKAVELARDNSQGAQLGRALEQDIGAAQIQPDIARQQAVQSLRPDNAQVSNVPDINLPVIPEGAAEASRGLFRTGSPLENPDPTKFDPDYDAAGKLTGWKIKEAQAPAKPAVLPTAEPKVTPEAPVAEEAGAPGMVGEEEVDQEVTPEPEIEKSALTPVIAEKEGQSFEDQQRQVFSQEREERQKKEHLDSLKPIFQNRDRSDVGSVIQMQNIAASPDYGMISVGRGLGGQTAPVVAGGNIPDNQLGKSDFAISTSGKRIPIRYAVVDASTVLTSNNISGIVNPEYSNPSFDRPVAIAGNGRITGLTEGYRMKTATSPRKDGPSYINELLADDQHGIDQEVIKSIPNPILVRVMPIGDITPDIGDQTNIASERKLSPSETAANDARRINFDTLEFDEDGLPTKNSVKAFVREMPETEQGELLSNGVPNQFADQRFRRALFAKAYNDPDLINFYAEGSTTSKLIISALAQLAPTLARVSGSLDITDIVVDAAKMMIAAANKNISLSDLSKQTDLSVDPDTYVIIKLFAENTRSNKNAIAAIKEAVDFAYAESQKEDDLLGAAVIATRTDVIDRMKLNEQASAGNVENPEGRGAVAPNAKGQAAQPGAAPVPRTTQENRPAQAFSLTGETEEEIRKREAGAAEEQRKADEKKIADQEVDMFGLQQQVQDRVTPEIEDIFGGDEDVSTEYKIALEKLRIAYEDFSRADLAYRAQEINDEEFLAARKRFDEIDAEYDKALEKENNRKEEKPKVTQEKKPPKEKYTKEQRDAALEHVKDTGGELVWQDGEYALIRGYGVLAGDPVYIPTVGSNRGKVDISAFTGKQIPDAIKAEMLKQKERLEKEAESKHEEKPFITFSDGVAISKDISPEIAGVIREWKNLLNLQPNIYVSTVDDASANKLNFTGPHRRIGSGTLDANERGSMRRMADGSYYILFSKSTSITKMLETIAHEFGHVHERLVFENATKEEKEALQKEHRKWLDTQKGKTAQDLIIALRAKTTGKTTAGPAGLTADSLTPYWKSFGEWYADQTARWAMSTAEPISIVEKYFRRLGAALRKFYQSLKGQNYLPSETFKNYIEAATKRPASLDPRGDEANLMQNGFNFDDDPNSEDQNEMVESSASKKALPSTDAMDAVISKALHEADQLPGAKKKLPPGRSPELTAAAQMVKAGTMKAAEFDKLVNKYKPIYLYAESLVPATTEKMVDALDSAKRDKVNPAIPAGTQVGLRLDIPAFNRKGVYVVSIHAKGTKSGPGKSIGYTNVAKVTNATFGLGGERAALNIAAGAGKDALQTIEGSYAPITAEQAYSQAKTLLSDPSWTQIGVDPTRHSYFYDRRTTVPVVAAEEVLQIGNMVLGKNVTYGKKEAFLYNIDTTPKETSEQKKEQALKTRKDKIEEYAKMRQKRAYIVEKIRNYGSSIATQRLLNDLKKEADELKNEIDLTKGKGVVTPENFLNQARRAMDGEMPFKGQSLSPEVFAVIQAAYQKTPWLLSGLRLSVRTKTENAPDKSSANFAPASRIVTLWNGTSGTEDPASVRHELTHSMEQMMTPEQRKVVIDAWFKSLDRAIKNNKDEASQKYFEKVLAFMGNPSERTWSEATNALPSYELYQYLNPSEFWAVNAEKLLAQQLGGVWDKFKRAMLALFDGLKNILGFDNRYAVHKVFNSIVNGERKRVSQTMLTELVRQGALTDFVRTSGSDFEFLNNIQDDIDLVKKWNRPNTPMLSTSPIKNAIINIGKSSKDIFVEAATHPINTAGNMINGLDRGVTYLRNKNVWFGTGLNLADQTRYGGLLRTTQGFATASVALDNAIRGGIISTEVIFQGGIEYDAKTMNYIAAKKQKGMSGVYEAEGDLKKRIGAQLGTDIIQGYLEAKRSRSIQNELIDRDAEVDRLKDELDYLNSQSIIDPKAIKITTDSLKEAQSSLTAIKTAEQKVSMSEDEIDEFIARESEHPELRDIMDNWNAVNQNMLKFWRNVGLLSQGRYDILSNIKDYVPWYRIMEDDVPSGMLGAGVKSPLLSTTRSMTNIGKEKLFKSGKPVVVTDFIAEDGQQTFKIQPSTVVQVEINDQVISPSNIETTPNGEVKINVPIAEGDLVVFTTNREIQNMIDNMTRNVMRMTMNGLRQHAAQSIVREYATRTANGKIKVFAKEDRDKGRFSFISAGKNIVVEIKDPLIAESVFGMESLDLTMLKPLVAAANFTRRAITLSGVFQLKQVFKDAPTAALVTGVKHPYLLIGGVFKGFVTALARPAVNAIGKRIAGPAFDIEPVVAILQSSGIGGFHSPSRTPEAAIKQRLGIMNRNIGSFILKALDHIGDSSDVSQRIAVYKRVLAETGDEATALYKAANVINFLHHGSGQAAQALVKTVPFMGAYANSIDVLATAITGGGLKGEGRATAIAKFSATASLLTASTLLYCMLVGADDEYNEMDDQAKIRSYMIPGTKIVLPMNTSAAFFFKAMPELIYNYVMKHGTNSQVDERRLREAMKQAALDMLLGPEPIPSGIRPFIEIGIKHDFFTGRSLTPRGMENIDAAEQYTETTSEAGKFLSKLTGTERTRALTPIEADHLIKGIFGTAGAVTQWASNLIGEPATIRPEMTAKQTPLIGPFMRDEVGRNRETLFYDLESVVNQRWETLMAKEGREKDTEKFDAENEDLLDMHKAVAKIKSKLNAINKDIRTAGQTTEKDSTPKERRKEITELKQEKNDVLDDVIEMRNELNLQ